MKTSVEVIIHPVCLRFSYHNNEIVYMFASNPEQQLDEMEKLMGVETDQGPIFDSNVGFLPVASTILIRGEKKPIVGRVCMDQFMVNTNLQKISVGEEAVILGKMGNHSITAEEMASDLGTIPYEILTGLNHRIPRVYHPLL